MRPQTDFKEGENIWATLYSIAIYLFPNSSHCSKKGIENEIADKASCERAETTNKYEEK